MENNKTYTETINDGALKEMSEMLAKAESENLRLINLLKKNNDYISFKNCNRIYTDIGYRIELHE